LTTIADLAKITIVFLPMGEIDGREASGKM